MKDGLQQAEEWLGSLFVDNTSGTTANFTTVNVGGYVNNTTGSPFSTGVTQTLTARSNISGGTWVTMSGGLAFAGPASAMSHLGVSLPGVNVASGGVVTVITQGFVAMVADGTIAVGGGAQPGAGAALNTVSPHVAGSAMFVHSDVAASGATVFIYLG